MTCESVYPERNRYDAALASVLRLAQYGISVAAGMVLVAWGGLRVLARLPHWQTHALVMVWVGAIGVAAAAAVSIAALNRLEKQTMRLAFWASLLLWATHRLLLLLQLTSLLLLAVVVAMAVLGFRLPLL